MSGSNASSTWSPLRIGAFRALWLAALASTVGTWMQTVGAQWLLVDRAHAALLVALVQTADMLPDVLFGMVGGVLADILDRRRLLGGVQIFLALVGAALAVLTIVGAMPPALLLTFTFVIGAGSVITTPAYQSLIPDLVPRAQLPDASALGSIAINLARAVGPAVAGLLIARAGVGAVFAVNAAAAAAFGVVVFAWRPAVETAPKFPEPFGSALRAGVRYVRYAPVVRSLLWRAALFLVPGSALWALLPLVASQKLHLGAGGYGLELGALGVGAVGGAFLLPKLRERLSSNRLLVVASTVFAVALAAVVLVPSAVAVLILLLPTGVAWMAVLATVNAALQLFLPAWVRARGLSVYQMVLFGSQAAGALLWGLIAGPLGLLPTFLIAAAVMMAGGLAGLLLWPLRNTRDMDRSLAVFWPEPDLAPESEAQGGAVLVRTVYSITAEREKAFFEAMARVRRSRMRTGATAWGLFRDGTQPQRFVEVFLVPSWEEHLRQHHERLTGTDRQFEEAADALSDPPPQTSHLVSATIPTR